MPPALLRSQLATLESLHDDEPGFAVDIAQPVPDVVAEAVATLN
jgi:gluconate kinase